MVVHVWRLGEGSAFSVLEVPGSPVQKHRGEPGHSRDRHKAKLPDRYATYCTLKYNLKLDLKPLRNLATGTEPVIRDFMVEHATLRCDARTHARNEKSSVSSWQLLAA